MFRNLFGGRADTRRIEAIDVAELKRRIDSGDRLLLLDVRGPDEYAYDGHIAGSRLLPLPMLALRTEELPKDMPIVIVCRSGNRSHVACEMLQNKGFTNVINLNGGMVAWSRAGFPAARD